MHAPKHVSRCFERRTNLRAPASTQAKAGVQSALLGLHLEVLEEGSRTTLWSADYHKPCDADIRGVDPYLSGIAVTQYYLASSSHSVEKHHLKLLLTCRSSRGNPLPVRFNRHLVKVGCKDTGIYAPPRSTRLVGRPVVHLNRCCRPARDGSGHRKLVTIKSDSGYAVATFVLRLQNSGQRHP
eukprot:6191630-Pleurochrysis_carterae.AAC.2